MDLLKPSHPSYSCDQAWFLFGMSKSGGIVRLFLVEARGRAQVHLLERVSAGGAVSPSCRLLAVHRSCQDVGIRSELVEEVALDEFMGSLVAPELRLPVPSPDDGDSEDGPRRTKEATKAEAMAALTGLGFKKDQAASMIAGVGSGAESMGLEDLVKAALRASRPS